MAVSFIGRGKQSTQRKPPQINDKRYLIGCMSTPRHEQDSNQTWGQLLSNVIDYITITLQFS